jgi:UDP-3-O-[3-hydroxymyristoyl] glucosamine N-acyltransferase
VSLADLAQKIGGEVLGDGELRISRVRSLKTAGEGDLAFVAETGLLKEALASAAQAILTFPDLAAELGNGEVRPLLLVSSPKLALVTVLEFFHPPRHLAPGVHKTAIIGAGCDLDESTHVGPYVVIGAGSRVGAEAVLHAHVVIGEDCDIGPSSVLYPHAVLYDGTRLGSRVSVHAGVVLGADGFGYATEGGEHVKVPQVGVTVIEDDVEIGANSAIDRAALEETRIGTGSKIDNLVQVGHNVTIGRGCILCGQAGIAGSAHLGNFVVMAGQSGAAGHLDIGDGVQVAAQSAVLQSVPAGQKVAGTPALDLFEWKRQSLMLPRLRGMARRLRVVEKDLEQLGRTVSQFENSEDEGT